MVARFARIRGGLEKVALDCQWLAALRVGCCFQAIQSPRCMRVQSSLESNPMSRVRRATRVKPVAWSASL